MSQAIQVEPLFTITSVATHAMIADRARMATAFWSRVVGLIRWKDFQAGEAFMFPGCSSIHTCLMRYPIDVVFMATMPPQTEGVICRLIPALRPYRLAWAIQADTTIELPVGTIQRTHLQLGEHVRWTPHPSRAT